MPAGVVYGIIVCDEVFVRVEHFGKSSKQNSIQYNVCNSYISRKFRLNKAEPGSRLS